MEQVLLLWLDKKVNMVLLRCSQHVHPIGVIVILGTHFGEYNFSK
jgi:hypothetical protein